MRIVGMPGSLRAGSVNRQVLAAAGFVLPEGVTLEMFEGLGDLPLFNEDIEGEPAHPAVGNLQQAIGDAEAVLIATPEYNGSMPGALKNALDWASRPHRAAALTDKPVAVVGASPSRFGAVRAQADVRKVASSIGAQVIDRELPVAAAFEAFGSDGRLADPDLERQLGDLLAELVRSAARVPAAA